MHHLATAKEVWLDNNWAVWRESRIPSPTVRLPAQDIFLYVYLGRTRDGKLLPEKWFRNFHLLNGQNESLRSVSIQHLVPQHERKNWSSVSPLIIHIYTSQYCWVSSKSTSFKINNGVGQGKVLAVFAYCFYCNELFNILQKNSFGCRVNDTYARMYGFSDDDILIALSHSALQTMVEIMENLCSEHGLWFSTDPISGKSKTKCISWTKTKRELLSIILDGNGLPWVDQINHLGNIITNGRCPISTDIESKKARYVARNCEITQEIYYASPEMRMKINDIFNQSWYRSGLWNFFGPELTKVESTYNKSIKVMLGLPYGTHRWLIEYVSKRTHIRKILIKRFLKMLEMMWSSKKTILGTLLRVTVDNAQSTTGSNLQSIA